MEMQSNKFARNMMAQKLMSENRDNPFNSRFFQPSDALPPTGQDRRSVQGLGYFWVTTTELQPDCNLWFFIFCERGACVCIAFAFGNVVPVGHAIGGYLSCKCLVP